MKNSILIVILTALLLMGGMIFLRNRESASEKGIACTMDARICPDGTSVGRVSPNCEFAPCPEQSASSKTTECSGELTPSLTEGPYYKTGSPQRNNLLESDITGDEIVITGYVYNSDCQPISNAWLDFWQADANGIYDNSGFILRGHQFADSVGRYELTTVIPAKYSGRTPHIHVKVRADEGSPILTTQLYFPGEEMNSSDKIFNKKLVIYSTDGEGGKSATFNFLLE